MSMGGALTPSTAYLYDWNLLPIGQQLWEQHLLTLQDLPAAASAGDPQFGWNPEASADCAHRGRVSCLKRA
jgi:hypothetical protein